MKKVVCFFILLLVVQLPLISLAAVDLKSVVREYNYLEQAARDIRSGVTDKVDYSSSTTSYGQISALKFMGSGSDYVNLNLLQLKSMGSSFLLVNGSRDNQGYDGYYYEMSGYQAVHWRDHAGTVDYARSPGTGSVALSIVPQDAALKSLRYSSTAFGDNVQGTYRQAVFSYFDYHSSSIVQKVFLYHDAVSWNNLFYYKNGSQSGLYGVLDRVAFQGTVTGPGAGVFDAANAVDYNDPSHLLAATFGRGMVAVNYSTNVNGRNDALTLTRDAGHVSLAASIDNWNVQGVLSDPLTMLSVNNGAGKALELSFDRQLGSRLISGTWNGAQITYRDVTTAAGRDTSLVIENVDGEIRSIGADRLRAIEHGQINEVVAALHDDLKLNLDFEKHFGSGGQDFVKFNDDTRLLSIDIQGYQAEWKIASDGYLQYKSPDGTLAFRANNPSNGRMDLPMFRYEDSTMSVKLDHTYLAYSKEQSVLGLYDSRSYMIKMYLIDSQQLKGEAKDIIDQVRQGNYHQKSAGQLIADNVKEVRVNTREIVRSKALLFKDRQWNMMFASLAWDVGEFALSGADLAKVVEAKNRKAQLYMLLDHVVPQGIQTEIGNKERSVFYQLGSSLMAGNSAGSAYGVTSMVQPAQVNFMSQTAVPLTGMEGVSSGFSSGLVDASVPLVGSSSYTHLSLRGEAQRAFLWSDNEVMNTGSANVHVTNLLYAYRFSPDTQLAVEQGYRRQFGVTHQARPLYNYNLRDANGMNNEDGLQDLGYVIPGMMEGISVKDNDQRWHADITLMPYVPVTMNDQMKFGLGNGSGISSSSMLNQLDYAVDMRGGLALDVFRQKISLEAGKDVNNMLSLAPELTLAEKYKAGVNVAGAQLGSPQAYRYHVGADALGLNSTLFVEQNVVSKTSSMGVSFDRKSGEDIYNFSTGMSYWDNAGAREAVENYYSVGVNLHQRVSLVNTLLVDQLSRTIGFQTSSLFNLDKSGATSVGFDAGMTDINGADIMLKAKTVF